MGKIENGSAHTPQNFKVWRENMGYTVDDACALLGVKQDDFNQWENDVKLVPRSILLACAALALGIKV